MNASAILIFIICIGLLAALFIVALSRHKKSATGELHLMGARAIVEKALSPEGSILVRGEMWPARAQGGETIETGSLVVIVGASGHLLEVEPVSLER